MIEELLVTILVAALLIALICNILVSRNACLKARNRELEGKYRELSGTVEAQMADNAAAMDAFYELTQVAESHNR